MHLLCANRGGTKNDRVELIELRFTQRDGKQDTCEIAKPAVFLRPGGSYNHKLSSVGIWPKDTGTLVGDL